MVLLISTIDDEKLGDKKGLYKKLDWLIIEIFVTIVARIVNRDEHLQIKECPLQKI